MQLFKLARLFSVKLAQIADDAPDTERTPMVFPKEESLYPVKDPASGLDYEGSEDAKLQAYELMALLDGLASIKNLIYKIRNHHASLIITFEILLQLRPGVIKNAIKQMIQDGQFDVEIYTDLKNAFFRSAEKMHLAEQLKGISEFIEISFLDNDKLKHTDLGAVLKLIKDRIRLVYSPLVTGLEFSV